MRSFAKYSLSKKLKSSFLRFVSVISFNLKMLGFEGFVWISALAYLGFFYNPVEAHFTICPLSNFGFDDCPGCGLGRSISLLFSGHFKESFNTHILGIPAVLILIYRIIKIVKTNYSINKQLNMKERYNHA